MKIIAHLISIGRNKNYNNSTQSATQPGTHFYLTGIFKRL